MSGLVVVAGLLSVVAASCPGDPIDRLFAGYDGPQPGASVAVIKDGAIVFERSYGLANVETGERATSQTNYRLASVTKQFTAMAITILADRGSLKLDDPVSRYLPELARAAPGVTVRHLLTHMSGLREYDTLLPKDDPTQIVDRDVLALIAKQAPVAPPGTRYRYGNTNYALLALIVERVSKLTYGEFLARNIFKPLGMTASLAYDPSATIAHRALGYSEKTDHFVASDQSNSSAVLGDGGVYSSVRDLAHWIDALDRSTLVKPPRLAEATRALVATDEPGISYGFGWRIGQQRREKLVYHTGTTSGFKNALVWVPSRKLAVIVLTNRRQGEPLTFAKLVLDHFWDH